MFAIVLAIILNGLGPPAEPLIRVIEIANDAIMAMVRPLRPFSLNKTTGLFLVKAAEKVSWIR